MRRVIGRRGGVFFVLGVTLTSLVQAGWNDWLDSARELVTSPQQTPVASSALSSDEIVEGLKQALGIGVEKAIAILGTEGGYLNDARVRIPLPDSLEPVANGLSAVGQGELVNEFIATINQAAEQAVPETLSIFTETIRRMTLDDARGILNGSDTAATDYFRKNSGSRLDQAILPIVKQATEQAGVTSSYKQLTAKVGFLGAYIDMDSLDLDRYVAAKALDGLFLKLAEQEKLIRTDPVARTTDILKKVFGGTAK